MKIFAGSMNYLDEILNKHKRSIPVGVVSICSANPYVLKAAMKRIRNTAEFLLVEATCNQVNQYGGYTGKTPGDFVADVYDLARQCEVQPTQIILGGDHLGPYIWRKEAPDQAIQKAKRLVQSYVAAGFTKIHLDTSMLLGQEKVQEDIAEKFANRIAELAKVAEETAIALGRAGCLRYVVGNEVPLPGGAVQSHHKMHVSGVEDTRLVIESTQQAFYHNGLQDAWERVIAIVVQPGVEFGNDEIFEFEPSNAVGLSRLIESYPNLIYEAHSTDYQTAASLKNLVKDHFAILKVGPALTFAFREAVFALAMIENELYQSGKLTVNSNVISELDQAMLQDQQYWLPYYQGDEPQQAFARKYSLSDRCRYYWQVPRVQKALKMLLKDLTQTTLPLSLISQYMPVQYRHLRAGGISAKPEELIYDHIHQVLEDYAYACTP